MIGPFPPAVGGLANNMSLLAASSLADRFRLLPFSTAKRRRHVFPNRPALDSLPYLIWHALKLLFVLVRHRPDAVYLKATSDTGFVRDTVLMAIARLFRRPILCHLHGRPRGTLFRREGGAALRFTGWGMSLPGAVIVLSPGLAEVFGTMFPGPRFVVVPNVVDLARFAVGERGDGPLRVLAVGRLSREKGTWDLLDVAKRLADGGADVRFVLCGIGETLEEEAAIRKRAEDLGVEGGIDFRGVVRGEQLARAYAEAGAFFLPSHAEIFPNVLLEAMASGLPIVTTDVPVIPEMFTEGIEGFRHPPGAVEAMAGSLARLAADRELRRSMGAASRRLAEERYGVEVAAERIGSALHALLEGRDPRSET